MEREVLSSIRELLQGQRVLMVAVLVDDEPEAGLLPYAIRPDFGAVYVQASGLARHARGLQPGREIAVLIHTGDAPDEDPMQLTRLTLRATVDVLDRTSDRYSSARALFVNRFAAAEMTLDLPDFNLYELTFGRGRYVEGFAHAFNIGPDTFREMAGL
jgi:putative heme iron utilization protein